MGYSSYQPSMLSVRPMFIRQHSNASANSRASLATSTISLPPKTVPICRDCKQPLRKCGKRRAGKCSGQPSVLP
jgi:hypothetical protein